MYTEKQYLIYDIGAIYWENKEKEGQKAVRGSKHSIIRGYCYSQ